MLSTRFRIFTIYVLIGLLLGQVQPQTVLASPQSGTISRSTQQLNSGGSTEDKIESQVLKGLTAENQTDFFIWMAEKADLSPAYQMKTKSEKGQFVFSTLRATAERTQRDLRSWLDSKGLSYETFYISNKILVRGGDLNVVNMIASRSDVVRITANHHYQLEQPKKESPKELVPEAVEPNISFVNADDVWGLGITGQGIVLAGNDTGLAWDHPAIINHYRGWDGFNADHNYNWWDATGTYPDAPADGFGHGTHTTGTMVGDDGGENQIGMAPGAKTIHCKNMDDYGGGWDETFIECFQWDLAPWDLNGENPLPDMAPDAVNNSWGYWGGNYPAFEDEIAALQAAGILVEVSAGNEGPGCQSLRSPADYGMVLTTGSVNHASGTLPGTLTDFSSRGPSMLSSDYIPDIMAPGENIRSAVPGGGYEYWSGTSMAGPHTTGLIALLWSANPALRGMVDETMDLIFNTAVPLTGQQGSNCGGDYDVGPNNDWGHGTFDAFAAVQAAMSFGGTGTLEGTVTDSSNNNPLENVDIHASLSPTLTWITDTDEMGFFSRRVFSGIYTVTADLYGYYPVSMTDVQVVSGTTTTLDIAMDPTPFYWVDGRVSDAQSGWPLYARIDIQGYPGGSVWTDPQTGEYAVQLAAGTQFNFRVSAWVDGYSSSSREIGPLAGSQTEDFALQADLAMCSAPGYVPEFTYSESFEGSDGGYTVDGTSTWEWGVPTSGPGSAHSGQNVWATNLEGNYNDNEYGTLTSPDIDLSSIQKAAALPSGGGGGGGIGGPVLIVSWWQYLQTEECCDFGSVDVSRDGGLTWETVFYASGNVNDQWERYTIYLDSSYAVTNFRIRFTLQTDVSITAPGFYVDDIGIGWATPPPTFYAEDFEASDGSFNTSGLTSWEWGEPTRGPASAHSGLNAWATNLDGNYGDNEDGYITSPLIDLSPARGLVTGGGEPTPMLRLSWWQWLQTESGHDFASIEVSDGITWTEVYTANGVIDQGWDNFDILLDLATYAVPNFQVRFRLQSDESVTYPGFYVDDVKIDLYTGQVPAVPCFLQEGGLVVGNVYDFNTGLPLDSAWVTGPDGYGITQPTPNDDGVNDGFYILFAPTGEQWLTAGKTGYSTEDELVTVVVSDTIVQDFYLNTALLTASPSGLQATLDLGVSTTLTFTLDNVGGLDTSYKVNAINKGFTPANRLSIPPFTGEVTPSDEPPSIGLATGHVGQPSPQAQTLQVLSGAPAFAQDAYPTGFLVSFSSDTPGTVNEIGPVYDPYVDFIAGADFVNGEFDKLYAVNFYGNQFLSIDTETAAVTVIGPSAPASGENWTGLTASVDGTIYASGTNCGSSTLYTIDIDTGTPTVIGPITNGACIIDIAITPSGEMYGVDIVADTLLSIDPATGAGTVIGYIGYDANFAQGMDYEEESGLLYMAAYGPSGGELRVFDTETGNSVPVGGFPNGDEMDGFVFATGGGGVPWLIVEPITGTLGAGLSQVMIANFDASVPEVAQPGDYQAQLKVTYESPYKSLTVPVTMTINAPQDWGKLTGMINGLGVCDSPRLPLAKADVEISSIGTIGTGDDGIYTYWLPADTYTITISSPGYITQSFTIDILAGQTTQQDIDLHLDTPCEAVSALSLEATLPQGMTTTQVITLSNTGAGSLSFSFLESYFDLSSVDAHRSQSYDSSRFTSVSGPASVLSQGGQAGTEPPFASPLSGWFSGLDLPGGAVRYAFAQCAEQPESYYVFSGVNSNFSISSKSWRYDAGTNDWTQLTDIPVGSEAPVATCYQGNIYVMGGSGTAQFFIYNVNTDIWSVGPDLPRNVEGAAAAAWDGKIYLVGGDDNFMPGDGVSGDVNVYDIALGAWQENAISLPVPASNMGFVQASHYLYVVGGWGDLSPTQNITATQRYDLSNDLWSLGPTFESARADFALAATDQALYAMGGDTNGGSYFDASDLVERLSLADWPAGLWAETVDQLPIAFASNSAGFCTHSLLDPQAAEVWSVGGGNLNAYVISGRTMFHDQPGESCPSIYVDVDWLSESPALGVIVASEDGTISVIFDATALMPGEYNATLVVYTNYIDNPLVYIPVKLIVTQMYHVVLPFVAK
jgi:subtilisin family serine protease